MVFSVQWLQKCTGRYCTSSCDPMVKLKPVVDSYTGPYKDKYRFRTGLLIFIHVCILLTALFSYTTQAVPLINNYIIAVVCVLLIRAAAAGVYRNTALNYLEFIHYFNLFSISLLSDLSYHLWWNNGKGYMSIVSVSISMIVFTATVLAHIYVKLERKTACWDLTGSSVTGSQCKHMTNARIEPSSILAFGRTFTLTWSQCKIF